MANDLRKVLLKQTAHFGTSLDLEWLQKQKLKVIAMTLYMTSFSDYDTVDWALERTSSL